MGESKEGWSELAGPSWALRHLQPSCFLIYGPLPLLGMPVNPTSMKDPNRGGDREQERMGRAVYRGMTRDAMSMQVGHWCPAWIAGVLSLSHMARDRRHPSLRPTDCCCFLIEVPEKPVMKK